MDPCPFLPYILNYILNTTTKIPTSNVVFYVYCILPITSLASVTLVEPLPSSILPASWYSFQCVGHSWLPYDLQHQIFNLLCDRPLVPQTHPRKIHLPITHTHQLAFTPFPLLLCGYLWFSLSDLCYSSRMWLSTLLTKDKNYTFTVLQPSSLRPVSWTSRIYNFDKMAEQID